MPDSVFGISQLGLASILKHNQLVVPPNQREYSWTQKETETLFKDFARSISDGDANYFLGTIVTIPKSSGVLEVVDGQQRLATTAIMLAEIRNYLRPLDSIIADSIESEFLTLIDRSSRARVPRLTLNLDDNDFFRARLIDGESTVEPTQDSHNLIHSAFTEAEKQVQHIVSGFDENDHGDILNRWIDFMETRAVAVLLQAPNDADAYRMFETLNDRGLRTTQSDLVKNYLFGRSDARIAEVQQKWALMRGALETIEDEDITIMFLRHSLTLIHGFVREHQVYEAVQRIARAPQPVVTFTSQLAVLALDYVAIHNADHENWNQNDGTRQAIEVLNLFGIKPMRPLMLAISQKIDGTEAELSYRLCVSICVRLMIAGSTRTGTVEEGLAECAFKVFNGDIVTTEKLLDQLKSIIPSDETFKAHAENASVSNRKLARYYLRSMELAMKNEEQPWHIPNDDRSEINLEHVLPQNPEGNWPQFSDEEVKLYYKRLGNLCLLRSYDNSTARSASFTTKKTIFERSPYELTSEIANFEDWTPSKIVERQKSMASLALETWPISVD